MITILAALVAGLYPSPAAAQNGSGPGKVPFAPGERMEYAVGYGPLPAGTMQLRVAGIEPVDGRPAYHIVMTAESNKAVSFLYELASEEESWLDVGRFHSLRYRRRTVEKDKVRTKEVRFDQDRDVRIINEGGSIETKPASPDAVDQLGMIYYLRLLPLESGARFVLRNQADPDDNPITIRVLKQERVKVPAGTFDAWVVDLDVKTDSGVFKKGGENRVWVSADGRSLPVKISSKIGLGSFHAELVDYSRGRSTAVR